MKRSIALATALLACAGIAGAQETTLNAIPYTPVSLREGAGSEHRSPRTGADLAAASSRVNQRAATSPIR